jgi:predicted GNAT superfamily acetyltransferase
MTGIRIRDLAGMADFFLAEALQRAVWGEDDATDPADLMMVIQAEGGLAAGAFRGDDLLGYVFAFPTRTPHIQHSHRLAVRAAARGLSLGLALKQYQRDWCLSCGITHVRWTFDPLRAANAALNIHRLGAQATTYYPDYYGPMAGINKGAPSDRLLADWHLQDPHVAACALGRTDPPADLLATALRIEIPPDFGLMLERDPEAAVAARLHVRDLMQTAFSNHYTIRGFDIGQHAYLLTKGPGQASQT